jgi:hypothetical protein
MIGRQFPIFVANWLSNCLMLKQVIPEKSFVFTMTYVAIRHCPPRRPARPCNARTMKSLSRNCCGLALKFQRPRMKFDRLTSIFKPPTAVTMSYGERRIGIVLQLIPKCRSIAATRSSASLHGARRPLRFLAFTPPSLSPTSLTPPRVRPAAPLVAAVYFIYDSLADSLRVSPSSYSSHPIVADPHETTCRSVVSG